MKFVRAEGPYLVVSLGEGREATIQVLDDSIVYAQEIRGLKSWIWRAEVTPEFVKDVQGRQHDRQHRGHLPAYDGWAHQDA